MSENLNVTGLLEVLRALLKVLPEDPPQFDEITAKNRKALREEVNKAIGRLQKLSEKLDLVRRPSFVFDPSNPEFVGKLIGKTLIEQSPHPLEVISKFYGSGVYALYYSGEFPAYAPIRNSESPIYVGKADPPTPDAKTFVEQGPKLYLRLNEHAKSIRAAHTTLSSRDFNCRFLVVQSGWQRSAEDYLVNCFRPIWNTKICYGFGKHGDAPETRSNQRSPWDTIHPGRKWATKIGNTPNDLSREQIINQIAEHFRKYMPKP